MTIVLSILLVLVVIAALVAASLKGLIYNCAPNEVLVFSGTARDVNGRRVGYRIIKGGTGVRLPLLERVDRMDLTNMVIDLTATNAYCRGGIPLSVQGVANVKVAGHEPVINNAIERFLGKSREEIMSIAKATLEGSLRGILSTLTPQQVNEDKLAFAERLVHEVEQDMTTLGLVVDTLKIQNVHDDVHYLDSIGRKRSAEVISTARVAEARAKSEAAVRQAENGLREQEARIAGALALTKADAQRRLTDAQTRSAALVAEERAVVAAQVAQTIAEIDVQKARREQVRSQLEADIIQPARAGAAAAQSAARAATASITEEGMARADALRALAESWRAAGPEARLMLLSTKLLPIVDAISATVAETNIAKFSVIPQSGGASGPGRAVAIAEQIEQVFGIDVVAGLRRLANGPTGDDAPSDRGRRAAPPPPPPR